MRICWGSQYGWCCLAEPQAFSVFFMPFTRRQEKIAFALPFRDGPKHSSSQWDILESLWDNFLECFCYKRNRSGWPLYSCLGLECDVCNCSGHLSTMRWQTNGKPRNSQGYSNILRADAQQIWKILSSDIDLLNSFLLDNLWAFTKARLYISHCGCKDVWDYFAQCNVN